MWKDYNLVATVEGIRHAVLVPGVGYCFPDRSCEVPEVGRVVRVTRVNEMHHTGKQFGYFIWEPYHEVGHSAAELAARYIEMLKGNEYIFANTLYYPVYKVATEDGPAYYLAQSHADSKAARHYLFGCAGSVELEQPAEIYSSMFEVMLFSDAFCKTREEAIVSMMLTLQSDADLDRVLQDIVDGRRIADVVYNQIGLHSVSYISVGEWHRMYLFLIKGLPAIGTFMHLPDYLIEHSGDMDNYILIGHIPTALVLHQFGKPIDEIFYGFRTIRTGSKQFSGDLQTIITTLPDAVQHVLQSTTGVGFDYMYPDYLCFDVDASASTLMEILSHATVEEFYEFLDYAKEQNDRSIIEMVQRVNVVNQLDRPLCSVDGDQRGFALDHSDALLDLIEDAQIGNCFTPRHIRLNHLAAGCIDFIDVYVPHVLADAWLSYDMFQLVKDRTVDELHTLVSEINLINNQAVDALQSAVKKGKLSVTAIRGLLTGR